MQLELFGCPERPFVFPADGFFSSDLTGGSPCGQLADLGGHPSVVGPVSPWLLLFCLLGHLVMSYQVLLNGVNISIVNAGTGGLWR